jgi:hypothetical protein
MPTIALTSVLSYTRDWPGVLVIWHRGGHNGKHRFIIIPVLLRIRCRGKLLTEPLPSNERLIWLHYFGLEALCHNMNIPDQKIGVFQMGPRIQHDDFFEDGLLPKSTDYTIFWVLTPSSSVEVLRSVGIILPNFMALQPRR